MRTARGLDYQTLKDRHIADYAALYNRVKINLGPGKDYLPLSKRLENWEQAHEDPALFALLFQYGRYLMIAGSRPGTTPMNLQGIWNCHLNPPWSSNYTVNINTEMNYWPVEVANLSECHEPLLTFLDTLRTTGAKTAKVHFNADGFTVHHNTDLWGHSTPAGEKKGSARSAYWPLGGGWFAQHAFDHYLYTMDVDYLREKAWPIIRDSARFFLDVLVEDQDGTLIFAPSTSPENSFIIGESSSPVAKTTTMTTAIIKENLINVLRCCDILKDPEMEALRAETAAALAKIPPYKIGSQGEFLEWSEELPEKEPRHRHNSHLYPLFPGTGILPGTELADACARTLDLRGEEGTGWALAWRICLWARLQQPERAYAFMKKQLRLSVGKQGGCYPNLFGAHPPYQIDSNFGACAGIAELLMQSRATGGVEPNEIILLPALPEALHTGYVKGLRAKGGVTVNICFRDGELDRYELTLDNHLPAADFVVTYNGASQTLRLNPGEKLLKL